MRANDIITEQKIYCIWIRSDTKFTQTEQLVQPGKINLESKPALLFGLLLNLSLHLRKSRCFVILAHLGSGHNIGRRLGTAASPVQSSTLTKNGDTLRLSESTGCVIFVGVEPTHFLGSFNVTVVPVSSSLHVL
jgi:hypothetical protein